MHPRLGMRLSERELEDVVPRATADILQEVRGEEGGRQVDDREEVGIHSVQDHALSRKQSASRT